MTMTATYTTKRMAVMTKHGKPNNVWNQSTSNSFAALLTKHAGIGREEVDEQNEW